MAGADVYVNEDLQKDKIANAPFVNGARVISIIETEEFAVSDGSVTADVYRFFKGLNPNLIITDLRVYVDDAVVGATDINIGLYKVGTGEVAYAESAFMDAVDLSPSGGAIRGGGTGGTDEGIDGLKAVDIADLTNKLYEHAGHTIKTYKEGYDIALTVNTDVTTGGTVTLIAQFIEG